MERQADRRSGSAGDFQLDRHVAFFRKYMRELPHQYSSMDSNRLTLLYFCVSALDLLDAFRAEEKEEVINYIYSLQSPLADHGGFYGFPRVAIESEELDKCNNQPHIANTYCALVVLLILGDDLSRVRRDAVAASLKKWQLPDGSFCCVHGISNLDSENDIRFVYCAACICYILNLWEAVDIDLMFQNILATRTYDNAFGMGPCTEAHGGCTYCALAALSMMGRLADLPGKDDLLDWCTKRQHLGFQGRIEKPMDTCYSFWVGGSLKLLGAVEFLQPESCCAFLKTCEFRLGGFLKLPESKYPDLLHSYFSVCGLSLCGRLQPLDVMLGMSERALRSATGGHFQIAPSGRAWRNPHLRHLPCSPTQPIPVVQVRAAVAGPSAPVASLASPAASAAAGLRRAALALLIVLLAWLLHAILKR